LYSIWENFYWVVLIDSTPSVFWLYFILKDL
jgi:hypothetical protein